MKHVACYKESYPRPQLVRENWVNLNGAWDFIQTDDSQTAVYNNGFVSHKKINVPFACESPLSGIGEEHPQKYLWYCRTFFSPRAGKARLHVERSDSVTDIWVNGEYVGHSDIGCARISCDISLRAGENVVCIRTYDDLSRDRVRGKQRWLNASFGCFYVPTSGIYGTVWLEFLPETFIEELKITPSASNGEAVVQITPSENEEGLYAEVTVSFNGKQVYAGGIGLYVPPSNQIQETPPTLTVTPSELHLWNSETPHLYDLTVRLKRKGKLLDEVKSYFGLRDIRIQGSEIFLNGNRLYLKMVLDQGYWEDGRLTPPSENALIADLQFVKRAGFNGVRKHQKIEDERFYYYADILGIYVWCEMPSVYAFNAQSRRNLADGWCRVLSQMYNHPSVITWVPMNESWGAWNVRGSREEQAFVNAMYYLTKSYDAMRPVISNDGWEHTLSDILTIHVYEQDAVTLKRGYLTLEQATVESNLQKRKPFAEGYVYCGQPILFSEFGGTTLGGGRETGNWGYGKGARNSEELFDRVSGLIRAVKSFGYASGYCYTQLTDVQQEINGILTSGRIPKVNISELKAVNDEEPVSGDRK